MRNKTTKLERQRMKESSGDVSVQLFEEDNDGRINQYGIHLRKNEWDALRKFYRELFSGERIETTIKFIPGGDFGLLNKAFLVSGTSTDEMGVIIEKKKSFLKNMSEIKVEIPTGQGA